jgi:hypothetical protein
MGFSFASVVLSYFLIAGGTFFAGLLAGRMGVHSEYLGYIVLAGGGFLGGIVAARASKGSTIIEPGIGAALLLGTVVALGVAGSGSSAHVVLLPSAMKAIGLTAGAAAVGGIAGAFVTEKLFGDAEAAPLSWVLYVALATFGAGIIGSAIGAVVSNGAGPIFGVLALCCVAVGVASGASAQSRPLGASFLGGVLGIGGFQMLAIYVFRAIVSSGGGGETDKIPTELYIGMAVIAVAAGIATLIGALVGWAAVGSKQR